MPPTSTKHAALPDGDRAHDPREGSIARARRRLRQGHYDRPEVRRILASLILRLAARRSL